MIANIMIANKTKTPIWSKGAIALIIDFKTTCKPACHYYIIIGLKMENIVEEKIEKFFIFILMRKEEEKKKKKNIESVKCKRKYFPLKIFTIEWISIAIDYNKVRVTRRGHSEENSTDYFLRWLGIFFEWFFTTIFDYN